MKPQSKTHIRPGPLWLLLPVALMVGVVALGCGCSKKSSRFEPLINFMKQQDMLTDGYFRGDAEQARNSLGQLLQFYQDPKIGPLADAARAQSIYETYERLYVLETRTGNRAAAEAALGKVREYQAKFYKLANASDQETAKAAADLTPEKIGAGVDEVDKRENNGQLPRYAQTATK